MKLCGKYSISFIAFSPLNQGILLGKYKSLNPPTFPDGDHRQKSEKFKPEYLEKAEKGIENISELFGNSRKDLVRISLQFVLYHKNVAGVIPGFRNKDQVAMNLALKNKPLNAKEIALINKAFNS
jgi:aryl-alcohol dehydrogenase-like predicted oxidoreductase